MTETDKSRDARRDKEVAVKKDVGTEEPKQKKLTLWQKIKKWLSCCCCCCCCCRCCPCYPEDEEQEALIQFFLQQQGQEGRKQPDLCQKETQGQEGQQRPDLCHRVEQIHVAVETTSSSTPLPEPQVPAQPLPEPQVPAQPPQSQFRLAEAFEVQQEAMKAREEKFKAHIWEEQKKWLSVQVPEDDKGFEDPEFQRKMSQLDQYWKSFYNGTADGYPEEESRPLYKSYLIVADAIERRMRQKQEVDTDDAVLKVLVTCRDSQKLSSPKASHTNADSDFGERDFEWEWEWEPDLESSLEFSLDTLTWPSDSDDDLTSGPDPSWQNSGSESFGSLVETICGSLHVDYNSVSEVSSKSITISVRSKSLSRSSIVSEDEDEERLVPNIPSLSERSQSEMSVDEESTPLTESLDAISCDVDSVSVISVFDDSQSLWPSLSERSPSDMSVDEESTPLTESSVSVISVWDDSHSVGQSLTEPSPSDNSVDEESTPLTDTNSPEVMDSENWDSVSVISMYSVGSESIQSTDRWPHWWSDTENWQSMSSSVSVTSMVSDECVVALDH